MADVQVENLDNNRAKLTITVSVEEQTPFLEEAANHISQETSIPGFRPGKAGYETVKQRVGAMKVLEGALEPIVRAHFVKALLENDIETVGSPSIDMEKMVPDQAIVFTAEVALMPKVTKLADWRKLEVKAKSAEVEDKDVELALKDLQRMQTKEVRAKEGDVAGDKDKVVVSMNMKKDNVPVEGGQSPSHAIYMTEEYYVPGLKEKVLGMKEGEEKTFTLPFPKDHVQKMLAGSDIEFDIKVKELYRLEFPELNDVFAETLGQKSFDELKKLIKENLTKEKEGEEKFRQEKEMLELISEKSRFEDIPDLLLNEEITKMQQELQQRVEEQGLEFDKYLESIKKSLADLKMDFTPQALMRIKVALLIRHIAKEEGIKAEEAEIDAEVDKLAAQYENEEIKKKIYSPMYREYVEGMLRNRKVIELLKKEIVK